MDFLNLPVEIGCIILNYLDLKTKINVYNSCQELKDYFATWGHIRSVVLSRSTLATIKTLNENLFLDLGERIVELNLSAVPEITAENLKPYIHRFVNLKSLDVTFTDIYLGDISDICPQQLKQIGINFYNYNYERITEESKEIFKDREFEAVHFVLTELRLSTAPYIFLNDFNCIKDLKITIADNYKEIISINDEENNFIGEKTIDINFSKLTVIARDCAVSHKLSKEISGITRLNFKQLEFIFFMYLERIKIYVSPMLAKLFTVCCSDLKVIVTSCLPSDFILDGNIVFKAWNNQTTIFDEFFFVNLQQELKDYFPTFYCMHFNNSMNIIDAPSSWICIDKCENFDNIPDLPDKIILTDFCRHEGAVRQCRRPISLCKTSKSLQHLTSFGINNIPITGMFFKILFERCPKLVTLNIYVENPMLIRTYYQSLSDSIQLAKLKNVYLCSENVKYEVIFEILSRCSSLENVHICEYIRDVNQEAVDVQNIIGFIDQCVNLYSLFIEADMPAESLTLMLAPIRMMAQILERDYLYIEIAHSCCGWNPFADVFSPSPLHIFQN